MPPRRREAVLFCCLLLLQSDRTVFTPDVGFRGVWRSHSGAHRFHSGWYSRLYTTLASSSQFIRQLGKLKLKRRFWCASQRRGFWESDVHGTWTEVGRRYPTRKTLSMLCILECQKESSSPCVTCMVIFFIVKTLVFGKLFRKRKEWPLLCTGLHTPLLSRRWQLSLELENQLLYP